MQEVVTLKKAAVLLRCSPGTVRRRIRAGKLRASKVGRQWRFRRSDLEASLSDAVGKAAEGGMTDLVLSNPDLVKRVRAADREARDGKFLSWQDVFGD